MRVPLSPVPVYAVRTMLFILMAASGAALPGADDAVGAKVRSQATQLVATAEAKGETTVAGKEGWMFFAPELRHLSVGRFWGENAAQASRATNPEQADPLPAILDFKSQLDRAGIELIVVPVPPKAVIYPEHIFTGSESGSFASARFDPYHEEFYARLRESGVAVLDLVPEFLARKTDTQLFCRRDTHWSGSACAVAAELLAREIRQRPWFATTQQRDFAHETKLVELIGDLARESGSDEPVPESLALRFVGVAANNTLQPVPPDAESPVILLGDSHNLVFHSGNDMHAAGAGLPDQLALELGFAVDLVAVRGSGATPARINLLRRARVDGYLATKKLVIWCFSAREFTESSGWRAVPVIPGD